MSSQFLKGGSLLAALVSIGVSTTTNAAINVATGFSDIALTSVTRVEPQVTSGFETNADLQNVIPTEAQCNDFLTANADALANAGIPYNCSGIGNSNPAINAGSARLETNVDGNGELLLEGQNNTGDVTVFLNLETFNIDTLLATTAVLGSNSDPLVAVNHQLEYDLSVDFRTEVIDESLGYQVTVRTGLQTGVSLIDYADAAVPDEVVFLWRDILGTGAFNLAGLAIAQFPVGGEINGDHSFSLSTSYDAATTSVTFSLTSEDGSININETVNTGYSVGLPTASLVVSSGSLLNTPTDPLGANVYFDNLTYGDDVTIDYYSLNNSPLELNGTQYTGNLQQIPGIPGMSYIDLDSNSPNGIFQYAAIVGDNNQLSDVLALPESLNLEDVFDGSVSYNIALVSEFNSNTGTNFYTTLMTPDTESDARSFIDASPNGTNVTITAFYENVYEAQGAGLDYIINLPSELPTPAPAAETTLTTSTNIPGVGNRVTRINTLMCRSVESVERSFDLTERANNASNPAREARLRARAQTQLDRAATRLQRALDRPLTNLDNSNLIDQVNVDAISSYIVDLQALLQNSPEEYLNAATNFPVNCSTL